MNLRSPAHLFALCFVLISFESGLADRAAAHVQYVTVALSGQAAPGTSAGVNYSSFDTPALNDAGQVAYLALLSGSGVTPANNLAIYAGPLAAPQLVARDGDAAPGTSAGVNYWSFETPALNDAGQVAYRALLTGSDVSSANDGTIYAGPLAAPQLVAREGAAAPGTSVGVEYAIFDTPALNDAGQVAYLALLTGSGVTSANNSAIYAGPLAAPQLVAREGGAAPGTSVGVAYSGIDTPALNDAGQVAYLALLIGSGVTSANNSAIYAGPLAAPQLVARAGAAAPGTSAGVNYSGFDTPALNDVGYVAYLALLTGSGVTPANDGAIYAGPLAAPQLVAREGGAAPGTSAGANYSSFETPALNDVGQVAYRALLTGSDVTPANDSGLFASDPTFGGLVIAREGDLFDVGGGDFRTIADGGIGFIAGRGDDTRIGLSNDGTLAFSLVFTDRTRGIFTAMIVPEPAALALLAFAGLTLVACRSALGRRLR